MSNTIKFQLQVPPLDSHVFRNKKFDMQSNYLVWERSSLHTLRNVDLSGVNHIHITYPDNRDPEKRTMALYMLLERAGICRPENLHITKGTTPAQHPQQRCEVVVLSRQKVAA